MNNRELPMAYRLWKNEARRLLRKVLSECRHTSEGDLLLDDKHKAECRYTENYYINLIGEISYHIRKDNIDENGCLRHIEPLTLNVLPELCDKHPDRIDW